MESWNLMGILIGWVRRWGKEHATDTIGRNENGKKCCRNWFGDWFWGHCNQHGCYWIVSNTVDCELWVVLQKDKCQLSIIQTSWPNPGSSSVKMIILQIQQVFIYVHLNSEKYFFHWWGPRIGSKRLNRQLSYMFGLGEFPYIDHHART